MPNTKSGANYSLTTALFILNELYKYNPLFWLPSISGFEYEPYAHQAELFIRLSLRSPIRALIGDDVGLGKTIEAMMVLKRWLDNSNGKAIILIPRAILEQWIAELRRIGIMPTIVNEPKDLRDASSRVYISKIDTAKRDRLKTEILKQKWDFIIIDECHKVGIVNGKKTERYTFVEELMSKNPGVNLLMLSATPHRGKNDDYLARLYLLDNYIIKDKRLENDYDFYSLTRNAIVFRRIKDHVNKIYENERIFPDAKLHVYLIKPSEDESKYYKELDALTRSILRDYYDKVNEEGRVIPLLAALIDKRGLSSPKAGLNTLTRIIERRAHVLGDKVSLSDIEAYLEEDEELEVDNDEEINSILVKYANYLVTYSDSIKKVVEYAKRALENDSRFKAVLRLIRSHISNGDSIIIFTEYRDTAGYVYEKLINELTNVDVKKLTGDDLQSNPNVIDDIKRWLQECKDNRRPCVLVSTDVAAEGLNLQAANVIINYEVPWTPLKIEQRIGRVWRLGQDRDVTAYIVSLATDFEKAIFDVLFTKLFAEISARVEVKTPEAVIFNDVNNEVIYDLTKYEGDFASAVEVERSEKGKVISERLTPYTLWRIYKIEGKEGLNEIVRSVVARIRELKEHYHKLGFSTEKASLQSILSTLVGFKNRRELTESVDLIIRTIITKLGGNYDEGKKIISYNGRVWKVKKVPTDLIKVLSNILQIVSSHNSIVPAYILCSEYDKTVHIYRVCIKTNPNTPYCTLVPVINDEIRPLSDLVREIPNIVNAGCIPANDSNLNDDALRNKVIDHVLKKGVYIVIGPFEKYINDLISMKVREKSDDWFPKIIEEVNDKVFAERVLSIFGGFEISKIYSEEVRSSIDNKNIEEMAMKIAIEYEKKHGRDPKDVSKYEHYDIYSIGPNGEVRYIEVKGHADPVPIAELTEDEFKFALEHHDRYWLYLVFDINRKPILLTIKDPLSSMDISTIEKVERRYILKPKSGG